MQNTIAIICDCDGTLADDTTEFLLKENPQLRKLLSTRQYKKYIQSLVHA